MKTRTKVFAIGIGALSLFLLNPPRATAQTNDTLKAMQDQLRSLGQQIQELLKGRAEDQEKIRRLEKLVGETKEKVEQSEQAATNAQQKAEETQRTTAEVAAKVQAIQSQPSEQASATRNVLLTGFADVLYRKENGENGSFYLAHFNPILLYRANDNVLAEGEMEMEVNDDGSTELNLEYAQIDYIANNYLTLIAGRFVLPVGVVREKLDAGWINKLPIMPLPEADGTSLIPENDIGVQARGAFDVGAQSQMTYAAYVANGPGDGGSDQLIFDNGSSVNGIPNGGGRLAVFHYWKPQHDIELGLSGQTGPWSENGHQLYSVIAVDATLHLGPYVECRGEYMDTWQETSDRGTLEAGGWWAQVAYKLAGLDLDWPVVNNLEAVFRYCGESNTRDEDGNFIHGHINQYALGLIYHITNTLLAKGSYEFNDSSISDYDYNALTFQAVYGF
jgi:hypothetical protein